MKPITIGAIILPSNSPNLTQIMFRGLSKFELIKPKIKNIIEKGMGHNLIASLFLSGQIAITKKTIKKRMPKLLLELIFCINLLLYY